MDHRHTILHNKIAGIAEMLDAYHLGFSWPGPGNNAATRIRLIGMSALLMLISASSCKKPPTKTKEQVMQERLDERLTQWKEGMDRNCRNRVMDKASTIADSLLLANARFQRDTLDFPNLPARPAKPDFVPPPDTIPVRPILEK